MLEHNCVPMTMFNWSTVRGHRLGHRLTAPPNLVTLVVSLRIRSMKVLTIAIKGSYRYVEVGKLENGHGDFRLQRER